MTIKPVITPALKGTAEGEGGWREQSLSRSSHLKRAVRCNSQGSHSHSIMSFTAGFACSKLPNRLLYTSWALCLNPGLGTLILLFTRIGSFAFSINEHYTLKFQGRAESTDDPRAAHLVHKAHTHNQIGIQCKFTRVQTHTHIESLHFCCIPVGPGLQLQAKSQG